MLADDLLRTSQLAGQFAVAAVLQDVSAHRLALPDRQTLKQVECSLTLPGKLLDAGEIAVVERQRRNAQPLAGPLIDPTAPCALP